MTDDDDNKQTRDVVMEQLQSTDFKKAMRSRYAASANDGFKRLLRDLEQVERRQNERR